MLLRGILVGLLVSTMTTGANAGVKIPLSAAIARCENHSKDYAVSLVGRGGEVPSDFQVDQRFRSCVHAKSGGFPPKRQIKGGIRISGSASIGIVFKN